MIKEESEKINAQEKQSANEKIIEKSKDVSQKKELIENLTATKGIPCPFPQHKGYAELWEKLTSEQQKEMKENIRISADGKIEMIKMKKKFSVLTAKHNGKDIFDGGSHEDNYGRKGIAGVTYLTGKAAKGECKKQGKKLLNNKAKVEQFIDFFPGESTKEKIFNFVSLFGLEKAGRWDPIEKTWYNVGSIGFAFFSRVGVIGGVYGVTWGDDASIYRYVQYYPSPFVACEDC